MKARPILFNGDMVRALLNGRKTQTRRVVKPQPVDPVIAPQCRVSPYGKTGDLLWVRETWTPKITFIHGKSVHPDFECYYRADGDRHPLFPNEPDGLRWKPSIYMPRWASRITLEITNVRVERIQDIIDKDALAEGVDRTNTSLMGYAKERFRRLWQSINGEELWESNPWVWVIEFKVHTKNVDEVIREKEIK